MSALGWLALAAACGLAAVPSAARVRYTSLAGTGRLATVAAPGRRRGVPAIRGTRAAAALGALVVLAVLAAAAARIGPALAVAAGAAAGVAGLLARDRRRERSERVRRRTLLTAVQVLSGELTAGSRPGPALAAAGAAAGSALPVFDAAAAAAERGLDTAAELANGPPELRPLAAAWRLAEVTGARLADVAEQVAGDLRSDDARRRQVAVALAGPRSSAALVACLPVLGLALGAAMGADPVHFLLGDAKGRAVCCAGVVLDAAGLLWIRAITRRAGRGAHP